MYKFIGLVIVAVIAIFSYRHITGMHIWELEMELTPMFEFLSSGIVLVTLGIIVFGLLVWFAETERLASSIISFLAFVLFVNWVKDDVNIWTWLSTHIIELGGFFIVYVGIGIAFTTLWKWPKYARTHANTKDFDSWRAQYPDAPEIKYLTNPTWFKLHPLNHKYRLSNWTILWPFSLFWTLLHDPITWLWENVFAMMGEIWLKIAINADTTARADATARKKEDATAADATAKKKD